MGVGRGEVTDKGGVVLLSPTICKRANIEYSVHTAPASIKRELTRVFPDVDLASVLIVPTMQPSKADLVGVNASTAEEKDRLLETFCEWAFELCRRLDAVGAWADFTDPCSGFPMRGERGPAPYPDVVGTQRLLQYEVVNCGCCPLLSHPKWGTKCYPATLFTTAPQDTLLSILNGMTEQS